MKCIHCSSTFEPTAEERELLKNDPSMNIPFCSKECFAAHNFVAIDRVPPHDRLYYHNGPKTKVKRADCPSGIYIRPMTSEEAQIVKNQRGRGFMTEGATGGIQLLLPSERPGATVIWVD